jgi:gamma-glutamyltranspeptidase/glutathione hydrolase
MKMIEPFNLTEMGHNSLKAIQVITGGAKSIPDRNAFLGDPDFVKIPVKSYWFRLHQNRMSDFSFPNLKIIHNRRKKLQVTKTNHTILLLMLKEMQSATTTLNDNYGSKIYCDELGFF